MVRNLVLSALRCREGGVAILTAVLAAVMLWSSAFAVDLAALYLDRRTAQGAVDLAAIAAAQDIDNAAHRARMTLEDNGIESITSLVVTPGNYRADPDVAPSQRFRPGEEPFNAVRVALKHEAPLYFAGALMNARTFTVGTEAVAAATAQGAFSIGSRLARLDGGVLNAVLGGLLGGNVQLKLMDYRALAGANVKLLDFMDALAVELDMEAGTYDDVLDANATAGDVLEALAEAARQSGDAAASAALQTLLAQSGAWSAGVPLDQAIDLGPYANLDIATPSPGFDPELNVMQMVSAAAAIANGANQVSLNLGAGIPGLANIRADLAIGEPPVNSSWFSVGEEGTVVRTAQTRLRIVTQVAPSGLLPGVSVRIPLYVEMATAEARLEEVSCGADPQRDARARVAARPGIAELWLGDVSGTALSDFSARPRVREAMMVAAPLLRVTGEAHAAATNMRETELTFDWRDVEEGTVKRTHTRDTFTSLFNSLLGDLDLEVRAVGLGLSLPGGVAGSVRTLLVNTSPALDRLVSGLLEALGVTLGEADVRMHGIRCDGATLVG